MKEAPTDTLVPPVAAVNQLIVPALAVALKVAVPVPHLDAGVVAVIVGAFCTKVFVKALVVL